MSDLEKIADALLEMLTGYNVGRTKKGFEAKALFKTFDRNRIWTQIAWFKTEDRKTTTKKAINLLVKRGRITCTPVLATYRRYKAGKPYRPIKHYIYTIVDNVLDLLAAKIKSD
jgi:hypothetical protein